MGVHGGPVPGREVPTAFGAGWWATVAAVSCVAVEWPWLPIRPAAVLLDAVVAGSLAAAGDGAVLLVPGAPGLRWALRSAGLSWALVGVAAVLMGVLAALASWPLWSLLCWCLARCCGPVSRPQLVLVSVGGLAWPVAGLAQAVGMPTALGVSGCVLAAASIALSSAATVRAWYVRVRPAWWGLPAVAVATSAAAAVAAGVLARTGTPRTAQGPDIAVAVFAAVAPAVVLLAAARRRHLHAEVVETLVRSAHPLTMAAVRDSVAVVLQDPTVSLRYQPLADDQSVADGGAWVGPRGVGERHRVDLLSEDGEVVAYLECDPARRGRLHLVDLVAQMCAPAVRNARLHEASVERLAEVTRSRGRIMAAALDERRRLERDLHDGAQQRLLAVSARLGIARAVARTPASLRAIDEVRVQLREVLGELRALARDIHPAVLESDGLAAALEVSAARFDVVLDVSPVAARFAPYAETAAYLTVHELLAEAARTSRPSRASVRLTVHGPVLRLSLVHDGPTTTEDGAFAHAADRLRALGGNLRVDRAVEGGVAIIAEVPCA